MHFHARTGRGVLVVICLAAAVVAACGDAPGPVGPAEAAGPPPSAAVTAAFETGTPTPVALTSTPVPEAATAAASDAPTASSVPNGPPAPTSAATPQGAAAPASTAQSTAVVRAAPAASTSPSRVVSRGGTGRKAVTLTFDAGADRGHAERILDELARQRVPAAFGMTGKWAESNRDLLARMQREGHELINHSYDHSSFTGVSWSAVARTPAERAAQLTRTERIIEEVTGTSTKPYFRPPFGDYDSSVLADVGALGYGTTVMWTVDSMGWRGWEANQIAQRCLEGAAAGAIYIFHVGAASKDAEALGAIIDGLRARGFEIVRLADLLAAPST